MPKYFIADGDPDNSFTINQDSGTITTTKRLDRDTTPAYHLTVVAEGISKVAFTFVNITVLDKNDNSPVFDQPTYHVNSPEDTPLDSVVFVAQVQINCHHNFDNQASKLVYVLQTWLFCSTGMLNLKVCLYFSHLFVTKIYHYQYLIT